MDTDDGGAALGDFCRTEYPRLVRLLHLYCGDRGTAEDLAQETLARTWASWGRVSRLDAPDLWARRVALNLAASWWRRRRTANRALPRPPHADHTTEVDETRRLLADLPARQRQVLLLRYYEDLSVADTAGVMGCREGTVKALTSQALDALRRRGVGVQVDDV
jgi:RNA polymerase sigma-70 factor (sigma-E family)